MKLITNVAVTLACLLVTDYFASAQVGNYFAGPSSGAFNTGSYNAFVGYQSGASANSGWYNTFLGYQSGFLNKNGSYNTFIGSFAGYDNTSGLSNTFVGWAAGTNNSTANSNSFFGNLAGYQTTSGANNSFAGSATGYSNTTGGNNSFYGSRAGYRNNGSNNVFVGYSAGENNALGYQNVFMGNLAGYANTSGFNNTLVGWNAGRTNTSGRNNTFFGTQAGYSTSTGIDNTFIGREAGRHNTTGAGNTCIGNYAQLSSGALSNSMAIGNKAIVRASNSMVLGTVNGENGATVTMKVGIGTTAPGYNLHVNGTAAKPGGGSWTVASDRRLKKDIEPFKEGLKELAQVSPVWFRYNGKAGLPTEKRYVGVIAQDMQKIAPHTVGEFTVQTDEGNVERYLDYDANALAYTLVNAVKELHAITLQQVDEIKKLKEEIAILKGQPADRIPEGTAARLWQNAPNPYSSVTVIRYYLPENATDAQIRVISMTGQEVYSRELTEKGESQIEISNQILSAGNYVYQLIVNGNMVDKKKMILSR